MVIDAIRELASGASTGTGAARLFMTLLGPVSVWVAANSSSIENAKSAILPHPIDWCFQSSLTRLSLHGQSPCYHACAEAAATNETLTVIVLSLLALFRRSF